MSEERFDQDEVNRRGVEPLLLVERGLDWPADVEVRAVSTPGSNSSGGVLCADTISGLIKAL